MKDIKIDDSFDAVFENGDLQLVTDTDEINQRVGTTLRTRQGEFEPDESLGLDEENLYGKNVASDYVEQDIQEALSDQVPEINLQQIEVGQPDENRGITTKLSYTTNTGLTTNQQINIEGGGS